MDFPSLIKGTRKAIGESQAEFATRFKTHANTVSRWESGQYQAPYDVLAFVIRYSREVCFIACPRCGGSGRIKMPLDSTGAEVGPPRT